MSVPIIGQPQTYGSAAPNSDLTKTIDIYDSEIESVEGLLHYFQEKSRNGSVDYDAFQREIKDRFHAIGFIVDVVWYETNVKGVIIPEIVIKDRTSSDFVFDRDQQVHEVTHNLLGLNEGGVIKTSAEDLRALEAHAAKHGH